MTAKILAYTADEVRAGD